MISIAALKTKINMDSISKSLNNNIDCSIGSELSDENIQQNIQENQQNEVSLFVPPSYESLIQYGAILLPYLHQIKDASICYSLKNGSSVDWIKDVDFNSIHIDHWKTVHVITFEQFNTMEDNAETKDIIKFFKTNHKTLLYLHTVWFKIEKPRENSYLLWFMKFLIDENIAFNIRGCSQFDFSMDQVTPKENQITWENYMRKISSI
jgi:hypothetical protein